MKGWHSFHILVAGFPERDCHIACVNGATLEDGVTIPIGYGVSVNDAVQDLLLTVGGDGDDLVFNLLEEATPLLFMDVESEHLM